MESRRVFFVAQLMFGSGLLTGIFSYDMSSGSGWLNYV